MTVAQAVFLAQWQEHCEAISAHARDVVQRAENVQNRGEQVAYAAITREADKLVLKSAGGLTRDQAITRVLLQSPELYDRYAAEHSLRIRMAETADRNYRRKVNKAWDDREALLDAYARTTEEQAALEASGRPWA